MKILKSYFFKLFLAMFISFFSMDIIFRIISFKSFLGMELIRIFLFDLTLSMILAFLFSFKFGKILSLISIFFFGFYGLLQINFKSFMGNYMSFGAAGDGAGRVTEQIKTFVEFIKPEFLLVFIPFVLFLILFIVFRKKIFPEKISWKFRFLIIFLIFVLHFVSVFTLKSDIFKEKSQIKSDAELYKNPSLIDLSIKRFGYIRFLYLDLININSNDEGEVIIEEPIEEPVTDYTRKIDDTAWLDLIKNSSNTKINDIHNFFINQRITPKNEMTGLFKDMNLIYIMVEAFDMMAINEELTPTLYRMSKEGFYFDNYYAPKYSCTTGESEYIGLTSIIPSLTLCTPNSYKNNSYETSIFALFNKGGYYSTSYHNYSDKFYDRTILHQNMGSIKFYNNDDLAIKQIAGWPSDLNLMEEAIPHFIDQDRFFSFIITSSMHFPYDSDASGGVVARNWDKVKNLPYHDKVKRYIAKAIELDKAMEYLLNTLEEEGKLDNTAIVMFGDHHPLNLERRYINEASSIDRNEDFNIDRLPFMIYNSKLEGKVISTTSSTFDVLPTVLNLFDLDYDPRYYVGKDIFSDEEKIVIFPNGSWATDKVKYFSSSGEFKYISSVDEGYVEMINNRVNNYFSISNSVLKNDYFKYRFAE